MAEPVRDWSRDAEELAACFTVHARNLFGYACLLSDGDRPWAGDQVQAAFEAAAAVWCTLRDQPADQRDDWLRDTLATTAQRRTGHPAGRGFVSPSHRRLTELQMARFRADFDAAAGLDRFAAWLRNRADGDAPDRATGAPGGSPAAGSAARFPQPGARLAGRPDIRPASLHALNGNHAGGTRANGTRSNGSHPNGTRPSGTHANGTANGFHANGSDPNRVPGSGGSGGTGVSGPSALPGSYGDPVSALYEEHYASLVRLAALLVHDTATAEEIVQDSFVAVSRRGGTMDRPLAFLRQSVLDRSRSARFRPGGSPSGSPPLLDALGALPARQREVLVLRYYANLSEEQAADAIGISRAALRRYATRANAALRTLLDAG